MNVTKLHTLSEHWHRQAQQAQQNLDAGISLDAYQLGKLSVICLASEVLEMADVYSISSQALEQAYEHEEVNLSISNRRTPSSTDLLAGEAK